MGGIMSDRANDFTGRIPHFYDHGLGPVFFVISPTILLGGLRPLVSESWNLGRIRVHLPFIRGFTYCPGAPLGTPSRKYQNKAPLAQSARRVARSIRQISGLL